MATSHRNSIFHAVRFLIALAMALIVCRQTPLYGGHSDTDSSVLVQQALQAELDGDAQGRKASLEDALKQNPNESAARWLSGFIRHEGRWLDLDASASLNSANDTLARYRDLRVRLAGNLAGEISLARWCRANKLADRERLHWKKVIGWDHSHAEARMRLMLREFRGQLMTKDQIDAYKRAVNDHERALRTWSPTLNRLRREIKASPSGENSDAWQRLAEIDDPRAVPSIEKMVRLVDPDLQRHLIDTIGSIPDQVASDALVRLSTQLNDAAAREAAARKLADHPVHAYVSQYLERLESPIQYVSSLNLVGDRVVSETRMRKERPDDAVNVIQSTNAGLTIQDPAFRFSADHRRIIAREVSLQRRKIAQTEQAARKKNAEIKIRNHRLFTALRASTGESIDDVPILWWDWWKQYNEYLVAENKREHYFTNTQYRQGVIRRIPPAARHECFPAGTLVHTETGKRAIETIRPGDKVLSKDPLTGELLYQIVNETTVRPPSDTMQLTVAEEQITATLGHPFWVVGKGWTMVKNLKSGDRLHGVQGSLPIDVIEDAEKQIAYNLIVERTHSYLVGQAGLLVHDNLLREATRVPLPGWKTKRLASR